MPEAASSIHVVWTYVVVFLGGGIGSALRHACNRAGLALIGPNFPAGTLFVNIAGCLLMGLFAGWFAFRGETTTQDLRLFLATGICGGFTTFSAFTLDAVTLWQRGDYLVCAGYVGSSFGVALAALLAGLALMRSALAG
jgi:CrcB protein